MDLSRQGGLRRHFNYSNVMSTLAVFLVIAGGSAVAAVVNSSKDIKKQSVKNSDVKKETLKSNRLKDGKAVSGADVIDDSLSGADIDESTLTPTGGPPSGPAGGSLTGDYPDPLLALNSVGADQIADNAVTTGKIADNAVSSVKVANESLGSQDIGPNSVGQSEIQTNGVGETELAASSVSSDELLPITEVANTVNVNNNTNGTADVACPAGTDVISGGGFTGSFVNMDLVTSARNGNGWRVQARNTTGAVQPLNVRAYCLVA